MIQTDLQALIGEFLHERYGAIAEKCPGGCVADAQDLEALVRAALQPAPMVDLRPRPDLTMDVLRRLKDRKYPHPINPSDVSVIAACILESLAEARS